VPGSLARALSVLPGAELKIESTDSPALQNIGSAYDLVVYENTAPTGASLPDAALLFVRPTTDGQYFTSRGTMSTPTVVGALPQDPLLTGVDLSGLTFGETPAYEGLEPPDWTEVVEGDTGPLIARGTLQGRKSVVLAFDIASSNISRRIAFPILIANIAAQLVPSPLPPSVPLGDPLVYRPSVDAVGVRITAPGDQNVELQLPAPPPEAAGYSAGVDVADVREVSFTDTGRAGEYQLAELAADGTVLGGGRFVVNAGHATESDLRPNLELPDVLATSRSVDQAAIGSDLFDLWPLFAAAALALLTLEWLLALAPWRRSAVAVANAGAGSGGRGRR
jgi:hypothetical protein